MEEEPHLSRSKGLFTMKPIRVLARGERNNSKNLEKKRTLKSSEKKKTGTLLYLWGNNTGNMTAK